MTKQEKVHQSSPKPVDRDHGFHWFTFMLSYPLKKQMTALERFTQWLALYVYIPTGILFFLIPHTFAKLFQIESGQYGDECLRVVGAQLMVIAFFFFVFARAKPKIPSLCIILTTTLVRIVYIPSCMYVVYRQELISAPFAVTISLLDLGLAVISILIWFCSSAEASVGNYFSCISQVTSLTSPKLYHSSTAVQLLGLCQLVVGGILLAFPHFANPILGLSNFHGHERGLLSVVLLGSSTLGSISSYSGGADSLAFNIAVVFYRLVFMIPLIVIVTLFNLIPFGLTAYLLCFNVLNASVISMALYMDKN